jgi:hypothetical protein
VTRDEDIEGERCRCRERAMLMPKGSDAEAEGYQVIMPITQQQSVLLANRCER